MKHWMNWRHCYRAHNESGTQVNRLGTIDLSPGQTPHKFNSTIDPLHLHAGCWVIGELFSPDWECSR